MAASIYLPVLIVAVAVTATIARTSRPPVREDVNILKRLCSRQPDSSNGRGAINTGDDRSSKKDADPGHALCVGGCDSSASDGLVDVGRNMK